MSKKWSIFSTAFLLLLTTALSCSANPACTPSLVATEVSSATLDPNELLDTGVEVEFPIRQHPNAVFLIEPSPEALAMHPEKANEWKTLGTNQASRVELLRFFFSTFAKAHSRVVQSVRLNRNTTLFFSETTTLFGKTFEPGNHHGIDLSEFFVDEVEYLLFETVKKFRGFELHVRKGRGQFTAGQVYEDTQKLLQALGIDRRNAHVHVIGPVFAPGQTELSPQQALEQTYFALRTNLWAEMLDVAYPGGRGKISAKRSRVANSTRFGSLFLRRYQMLLAELVYAKGVLSPTEFKIGWVGVRGNETYQTHEEDPALKWGFEARFAKPTHDQFTLKQFLDALQKKMLTRNFNPEQIDFAGWSNAVWKFHKEALDVGFKPRMRTQDIETVLYSLSDKDRTPKTKDILVKVMQAFSYIPPIQSMGNRAEVVDRHQAERALILVDEPVLFHRLGKHTTFRYVQKKDMNKFFDWAVKPLNGRVDISYLLHNWALDPLLYNKPEKIEQIAKAQAKAITAFANFIEKEIGRELTEENIARADAKMHQVIKDFILESGLMEVYSLLPK